jgi:limonene-1,2-epoxide hydrolase
VAPAGAFFSKGTDMSNTRRNFLVAGGAAAAAALGWPTPAAARDLTGAEQANVKVVNDFSAAWATGDPVKVTSFLSDDCVVRFLQNQEPIKGRAVVTERLKAGMQSSKIEFEVHETFAIGSLVANYRTDYITGKDGKRNAFRVGGVFYLRDGKIIEWIDSVVNA